MLLDDELCRSKPTDKDNNRYLIQTLVDLAIIPALSSHTLRYKPRRPSRVVGDTERTTSFTVFDRRCGRLVTFTTILRFYQPSHRNNFNSFQMIQCIVRFIHDSWESWRTRQWLPSYAQICRSQQKDWRILNLFHEVPHNTFFIVFVLKKMLA